MQYGLSHDTIKLLNEIFSNYSQITEVLIYGSRAKGNFSDGSDIDLTLKGNDIDFTTLQQLGNSIDNLLLPWLVDLSIFSSIKNKDLIEHINRIGKSLYKKTNK